MKQILQILKLIATYDDRRDYWYNRYLDARTEMAAHCALERCREADGNMHTAITVLGIMGFTVYVMKERISAKHYDGLLEYEYIRGDSDNEQRNQ